jgi:DNA polymerase-3 subunit gamma/tau
MAVLLQQMAVVQAVPDALDAAEPETATTVQLAARLPADETQLLYSIVLHGRGELHLAPDEYSGLTMVLLRLLAFKPHGSAQRASAPPVPVSRPAQRVTAAAASTPAPAPVTRAKEPPPWVDEAPDEDVVVDMARPTVAPPASPQAQGFVGTVLGERWAATVKQMIEQGSIAALVRELALQAECTAIEEGDALWRLRVEREALRASATVAKLQAALGGHTAKPVRLEVEAGVTHDTPARRDAIERERRQREAEQIIHDDPLVQQMLAQFKTARIVPGSIKPH